MLSFVNDLFSQFLNIGLGTTPSICHWLFSL